MFFGIANLGLTRVHLGPWQVGKEVESVPDDQQAEHGDRSNGYGTDWSPTKRLDGQIPVLGVAISHRRSRWFPLVGSVVVVHSMRPLLAYHWCVKRPRRDTSDRRRCDWLPVVADGR